ncbi:MAG: LysR family transcriptional regulator [Burkholderiales bacterium]|nr:LysR family transcriptional regulator [Burkholderiales bacterium]ODU72361.1 MAG: hypothetical protein ABT05_00300 [Lautropia sp. SCN 66-9]
MRFDFDLVDLHLLINVVDSSSLTRGAARSHMSAPAASARIKKMEEGLHTQLFYRTTQGLVPTSSGHTVLRHARLILGQVGRLTDELNEGAASMKGSIRLYANTLSISEFVPPTLQSFLLSYPEVNIDLQERPSAEIARALRQGTADVGILAADAPSEGLECLPYRSERLVLVTAASHSLAQRQAIDFSEIEQADYVGLNESVALQAFISRAAAQAGFAMKIRIQASNFEALCSLVESGVGVGIVPESVARRHAQRLNIAIVALRDRWAVRDLEIAVRDRYALSAPVQALIDAFMAPSATPITAADEHPPASQRESRVDDR